MIPLRTNHLGFVPWKDGGAGPEANPAHSEAKRRGWPWGAQTDEP